MNPLSAADASILSHLVHYGKKADVDNFKRILSEHAYDLATMYFAESTTLESASEEIQQQVKFLKLWRQESRERLESRARRPSVIRQP